MQYTGESIAKFLTLEGLPVDFIKIDEASQLYNYYFTLKNPLDISKLKKYILVLETEINKNIATARTEKGFILQFAKVERDILRTAEAHETLKNAKPHSLILGKDTQNEWQITTLDNLPHLLIAGTTGSGKSICLNSIIMSLVCYNKPSELELDIIDLKRIEYTSFRKLAHLNILVTEQEQAELLLFDLLSEMEARYKTIEENGAISKDFKKIIVVIDELSDLILQSNIAKNLLIRLLQKSRGANIHFIVATQSPRAKILDGNMLANLPSRIALTCSNSLESVLILGHKGAESLTGKGDAILKLNGTIEEKRIQIPLITKREIEKLIE